jgi:DHA1 family bicyclomycin/chloramphenicol resistance-like MFS transporter
MPILPSTKHFATIITIILAGLVALSPLAIDTYLVAMPAMATFFGVEINIIELTITLYFLGFAIGNFFGGPLTDAFGRKKIALIGVIIYGLSALLISISPRIEYVLALRVLQAFGGGFATVTANVMVRDWYSGKKVASIITGMRMIMMLAPLLAPVIGTVIVTHSSWKGVFVFLSLFAILMFITLIVIIPESRKKELITQHLTAAQFFEKYKIFFSDKSAVLLLFSVSMAMVGLYVYLPTASFIFMEYFGVSTLHFPMVFAGIISLNILFSFINTQLLKRYMPRQILRIGLALQLLGGLLFVGIVLTGNENLTNVFMSLMLFIGSLGLIFGNGSAAILNINPKVSGSANATLGITRFLLSSVIGSIIAIFHTGNLIPVAVTMMSCSLVANLLFVAFRRHIKATE